MIVFGFFPIFSFIIIYYMMNRKSKTITTYRFINNDLQDVFTIRTDSVMIAEKSLWKYVLKEMGTEAVERDCGYRKAKAIYRAYKLIPNDEP